MSLKIYSCFSPGLIADIDIESEKYRWMGSVRIDFYVSFKLAYSHLLLEGDFVFV